MFPFVKPIVFPVGFYRKVGDEGSRLAHISQAVVITRSSAAAPTPPSPSSSATWRHDQQQRRGCAERPPAQAGRGAAGFPEVGLAFSRDGRRLASWDEGGGVRLWDTGPGVTLPVLRGHKSYVYPVVYAPVGRLIASGSWDGSVHL